jgi:branched-chain amino acid aminotransferase
MKTWLNGRLLQSPDEPAISALDHGIIVGDGVFETVKVELDQPFALTRHLDRLVRSAEGLGIGTPDIGAIREGIAATLEGQDLAFGRIRITVTSGPGPLGSPRGAAGLTTVVIAEPSDRPPSISQIATVPWPRNERGALAGLKTTSYAENVVALAHAKAQGATEALMMNTVGQLCEGTGSNVFVVLDGELVTPPLSSGCLAGVTRALVLEWTDAVERDIPPAALLGADEVFLTSSTRDVQGVHAVGDDEYAGAPGPVTQRVSAVFAERAAAEVDP